MGKVYAVEQDTPAWRWMIKNIRNYKPGAILGATFTELQSLKDSVVVLDIPDEEVEDGQ